MKKNTARSSKVHPLVTTTSQAFAHQHSDAVARQRELHQLEVQHADEAIEQLTAALAAQRRRKTEAQARIVGLTLVLERRLCSFGAQQV